MNPWKMTEDELLAEILERCKGRDLWPVRVAPERIQQRIAENNGFPDLTIWGPRGVLLRELKTNKGRERVRSAQTTWKHRFTAGGFDWDIWTPSDLASGYIDECLRWLETPGRRTDVFSLSMARSNK